MLKKLAFTFIALTLSYTQAFAVSSCKFGKKIVNNRNTNQTYYYANSSRSADNTFIRSICNSRSIRKYWGDFGMEKGYWDGGMGYYRACDANRPLGRVLSSLKVLDSSKNSRYKNSILYAAYDFSKRNTQHLRLSCGTGSKSADYEWKYYWQWSGFKSRVKVKNRTMMYWPGIYNLNVVARAGTILHEARHRYKKHNGGSRCPSGGSCDSSWAYYGSNTYKALYLWWYGIRASNSNSILKKRALNDAQYIIDNRFVTRPRYKVN